MMQQNLMKKNYDFLIYLIPKTMEKLKARISEALSSSIDQSQKQRLSNCLDLMRFFLVGYQIDPSYFLDTLESLELLIKYFSDSESIDLLLLAKVINLV